jgi:hypothetical protein
MKRGRSATTYSLEMHPEKIGRMLDRPDNSSLFCQL